MSTGRWTDPRSVATAHAWLREAAAGAGRRVTGPIEQPHVRPWSTVFRAPTDRGDVHLKLCGASQAHEPALTALLARTAPAIVPEILALHPSEPWMLLADGGRKLREVGDGAGRLGIWERVLPPYAELQRSLLGHEETIRATRTPDHGLDRLAADFRTMLEDDRPAARSEAAPRARLQALLPEIAARAAELAASGIGDSIQHDDLHDGNVLVQAGRAVVFDWGDASLTHPFLSLGVLLEFSAAQAEVGPDHPSIVRLRDAYLEPWTASLARPAAVEAAGLGARLSTLTRALSWHRVVTLNEGARQAEPEMTGRYLSQVLRALDRAF